MTNETLERPVLLLDIDGVLNLFPKPLYSKKGKRYGAEPVKRKHTKHRVRLTDDQEYPCALQIPRDAAELVGRLNEHFEIHWYTMWNEHSDRVFAPLAGLPAFTHFECDWAEGLLTLSRSLAPDWMLKEVWTAKTPLIEKHLGTRPFVWIDDDSNPADIWYLEEYATVGKFRLITVDSHTGLTQAVVDEAIDWAVNVLPHQEEYAS